MGLLNREHDLHLYAPAELISILQLQLDAAGSSLPYQLHFYPLSVEGVLLQSERFKVTCFQTRHRIPCWGFRFEQVKLPRKVNPEKALRHEVPSSFFDELKKGINYTRKDGTVVDNALVTDPGPKPLSYAFTADTIYDEALIPWVSGVDMLYHETTYLKELNDRAAARFHATTHQAATIALKARVGRLLIGHFSSKYDKLDQFESEAREIFPNTDLALEGVTFKI
jgi:ribonuclease Z